MRGSNLWLTVCACLVALGAGIAADRVWLALSGGERDAGTRGDGKHPRRPRDRGADADAGGMSDDDWRAQRSASSGATGAGEDRGASAGRAVAARAAGDDDLPGEDGQLRAVMPGAACPPCPQPLPAPACPAALPAPVCPPAEQLCAPLVASANAASAKLKELEDELRSKSAERPGHPYDGATAADRRTAAAGDDHLLIEMPNWGDDYALSDKTAEELGLTPEQRAYIEHMYRSYRESLQLQLQKMYADLVGDPNAGADSTLNALVHDLMGLSPHDLCAERILGILAALSSGAALPAPAADAPACELAVLLLFSSVDQLEADMRAALGETGLKALWSGTSTFNFSADKSK